MASRIVYESGSGAGSASLEGPVTWSGTAYSLRGRKWSYSLGYLDVADVRSGAVERTLDAAFTSPAAADALRALADRDLALRTPGTLSVDGWERRCYMPAEEVSEAYLGFHSSKLTVVLLDGFWRRWHRAEFRPAGAQGGSAWLDLPCDLPCDLGGSLGPAYVSGAGLMPSPVRITFHGPVLNPEVEIGGNVYRVEATVPDGARLLVDGASWPRSITMTDAQGVETDLFWAGERGGGQGSGRYVFEPLKPGPSEVRWDGGFAFDVEYAEEVSAPAWDR